MDNKKIEVVKKKGVPLGKPLQLTDADLDRLSVITPMDIEEAKIAWRRNVPKKYKNLLDAEVKPTDANQ
jgi:protein-tyrosine-phosphatase